MSSNIFIKSVGDKVLSILIGYILKGIYNKVKKKLNFRSEGWGVSIGIF